MTLRTVAFVACSLLTSGCGTLFMREATEEEIIAKPPAGKVLVNFHRPSDYGEHRKYSVFARNQLIGVNRGEQRFQYVCEPGEQIFIGYLNDSIWATVSVIRANLKADKIYDCIVDLGYFTSSIAVNPLKKGEERREEIPEWEEDDETVMVRHELSEDWAEWEIEQRENLLKIQADFLEGEKKERVKILAPDDHR